MITETDPQRTGVPALDVKALSQDGEKTANVVNEFVRQARGILREEERANMVLLRGFSGLPHLPSMGEAYQLNPRRHSCLSHVPGPVYHCGYEGYTNG